MRYSLAALVRRFRNPRRTVMKLRQIKPTQALAANLYAGVYKPVIEAWSAAIPRIVAAYERSLPVKDGLIRDDVQDVNNVQTGIGAELNRLVLSLSPELATWALRVDKWHAGQWRGAVLSATGVDLNTVLMASGTPKSVQETVAWNTSLIKNVSEQAQARIASAVFAAFQQRKPAVDLARELEGIVDMSRTRSLLIASDQTQKLSAALDSERMQDAGIEAWIWRHSAKAHPRPEHVARDGRRYTFADPPADMPGELPYCGCKKEALLELS